MRAPAFASILACPQHLRLGADRGNADCPVILVEGIGLDMIQARNLIERFFNKIKQCRRVATRYDKHAANYLAFVKLASIRIWLRADESAP
jgi:hypothetical protein